jgi:hypothetical protein
MYGCGISLAACGVSGPVLAVVCGLLATAFWEINASNIWAIIQTLAGPEASGKWTGPQNFLGRKYSAEGFRFCRNLNRTLPEETAIFPSTRDEVLPESIRCLSSPLRCGAL